MCAIIGVSATNEYFFVRNSSRGNDAQTTDFTDDTDITDTRISGFGIRDCGFVSDFGFWISDLFEIWDFELRHSFDILISDFDIGHLELWLERRTKVRTKGNILLFGGKVSGILLLTNLLCVPKEAPEKPKPKIVPDAFSHP